MHWFPGSIKFSMILLVLKQITISDKALSKESEHINLATHYVVMIFLIASASLAFGIPMVIVALCSVIICIIIIVLILKKSAGNFFQLKIVDRVAFYTVTYDLLFYAAQVAHGVHRALANGIPEGIQCSVQAILLLEFAYSQTFLSIITAIFVFMLILKGRQISFGKYDWRMQLPVIRIPLAILITAAGFGQLRSNRTYCGFREVRGLLSWHFLGFFLIVVLSILTITILYLIIWCYVRIESNRIKTTLQKQTAVRANRLAFKLSLFVLVYVVQFGGNAVEGLWISISEPPLSVRYASVVASVTGGILNGIVYFTIRRTN